ncbi:hypothetical protein [Streptococcus thoraltensis]|uniref:hypothetical protein n=1 Tax=Streptococcus thoraltensis TaxID=55085 RepID=UPI00036A9792|nr:hypothetical protein [Streptococcus thoraltensis]
MLTYNDFTKEIDALDFEACQKLYDELLACAPTNDSDFDEYWKNFVKSANEYTTIRSNWYLISKEERQTTDSHRTTVHNRVITNLKMVSKLLELDYGLSPEWFDVSTENRKQVGDFANYIAYVYAVNGR